MFGDQSHGTRLLPNGDLVVAMAQSASSNGFLLRILPDGRSSVLASGFQKRQRHRGRPAGLRLRRRHEPETGGAGRRGHGSGDRAGDGNGLEFPYGLTFSPDYRTLYIGERSNGNILALEIKPDGTAGAMRLLARDVGAGLLDGMAVDECGNVYVCGYDTRHVYRVAPGGGIPELVADLSDLSMSIANMQWGSGVGGWDPFILYVIDQDEDRVYELDVRVRGKRVAHLP